MVATKMDVGPSMAPMTPMEAAWKEAFSDDDPSRRSRPPKRKRRQRERGMPKGEEREDLLLRTLRYRS